MRGAGSRRMSRRREVAGTARGAWLLASLAAALLALALVSPFLWQGGSVAPSADPAPVAEAPPARAATPPRRVSAAPVATAPSVRPRRSEPLRVAGPPVPMPEPPPPGEDLGRFVAPEDEPLPTDDEAKAPYFPQPVPYEGPTGIEVFPPRGTKPVRSGIVVPDDFPLPEGYVRHYQVDDRGEQLPAILMVHPDYQLLDENGQPITTPGNRVVPPEYAPEGLPLELLELPEAQE